VQQHRAALQVEVVDVEPDRLTDPGAGAVEELEQRLVTRGFGGAVETGRFDEREHVVERQRARQSARRRRWSHRSGRIRTAQTLPEREPMQPAGRDHGASGRGRAQRRMARRTAA
jgi:hypothetical protein